MRQSVDFQVTSFMWGDFKTFGGSEPIRQTAIGTAYCHRLFDSATVSWCNHFGGATGIRPFYYPRPVLAFGCCRCLRLSVCLRVNHLLVRAITRDAFKLGSPDLDQRCKRHWLRSLLFFGLFDLWPTRSNLTWNSKFTPFWASPHHNSPPIQAKITKFGPEVQKIR